MSAALVIGAVVAGGALLLLGGKGAAAVGQDGPPKAPDGEQPTGGNLGTTDTRPAPGETVAVTDGEGNRIGTAVGNFDGSVTTTTLGGTVVTEPPIADIEITTLHPGGPAPTVGHGIPTPPSGTYQPPPKRPVRTLSPRQQSIMIKRAASTLKLRY